MNRIIQLLNLQIESVVGIKLNGRITFNPQPPTTCELVEYLLCREGFPKVNPKSTLSMQFLRKVCPDCHVIIISYLPTSTRPQRLRESSAILFKLHVIHQPMNSRNRDYWTPLLHDASPPEMYPKASIEWLKEERGREGRGFNMSYTKSVKVSLSINNNCRHNIQTFPLFLLLLLCFCCENNSDSTFILQEKAERI